MENSKFDFGEVVIAHCVVNMFSSAYVIGQYVDEHTIKPLGEKALFDKCDAMYAFYTFNDASAQMVRLQKDVIRKKDLQDFVDYMRLDRTEKVVFHNV